MSEQVKMGTGQFAFSQQFRKTLSKQVRYISGLHASNECNH